MRWRRERPGRAEALEPRGPREDPGGIALLGASPWLVLGGGGLKGLGHAGAWRALSEVGFRPAGIVGTSIGALAGAALAGGLGWSGLVALARNLRRRDLARVNKRAVWVNGIRASSLLQGEPLRALVERVLPVHTWEELRLPLQINAVDLGTGETHWFGVGARTDLSLVDAIVASCSLPLVYPPVPHGELWLVDGGAGDALALARPPELGSTGMLAVDVGSGGGADAAAVVEQGLVALHSRVFSILSGRRRRELIEGWEGVPLRLVRPRLDGYGSFDFDHIDYFIEEGYRATRVALRAWGVPLPPPGSGDEERKGWSDLSATGRVPDQRVDGIPHDGSGET